MGQIRNNGKIEKIDLPKKEPGSVVEAAYLNGIFRTVESVLNGLIDSQILFEGAAAHRVQGLQIKSENEDESIYVTELDGKAFNAIETETASKYAISVKDIINETLWTNKDEHGNIISIAEATEYAWDLCKTEIKLLWLNNELMDNIKKEVLDKLLKDIQEQIIVVFRQKTETELFDINLVIIPSKLSEVLTTTILKHHANENGDVPSKSDAGLEVEPGVLVQAVLDTNPLVSLNDIHVDTTDITLSTEANTGEAIIHGKGYYKNDIKVTFTYANFPKELATLITVVDLGALVDNVEATIIAAVKEKNPTAVELVLTATDITETGANINTSSIGYKGVVPIVFTITPPTK